MSLRTWHFYSLAGGCFTGEYFSSGDDGDIHSNIPEGCGAVEHVRDWRSQRVDLGTGLVVDHQPPQPSDEHEWNADSRRWALRVDVAERRVRRAETQRRIDELERRQLRSLRELQLDPENAEARRRLAEIEAEIAEHRAVINGANNTEARR